MELPLPKSLDRQTPLNSDLPLPMRLSQGAGYARPMVYDLSLTILKLGLFLK